MELTEQQERQVAENALKTELGELNKEYPDLKLEGIEDLSKLPNADKIFTLAKKGYSLLDAYESTNKAEIRKQQAEAARQATLNSVSGKGHLKGNGQGSEIDTTVIPDDVLEMYKKFNPGKSLDEYRKHYKQSLS
jgi:Mor family transcriptional regulator